ncbi:MAG TPA: magnesium transporter CorA family protein, partial [Actinomycetota bacterium]|nr:magnesium transporter CorA family protein [Actinomycetota bacterium]
MISCRVYRDGQLEREAGFSPEVIRAAREGDHRVWLDVVDPTDEELEALRSELGLHELAVEDSRRWGQRAKVDFYPGHLFLVAHGLDLNEDDELVDREVHLFAGAGLYVVTVRREPRFEFDKAHARLSAAPDLSGEGIGYLLYLLLDEVVDGYLNVIERFEDLGDDIEDAVASEEEGSESSEAYRAVARRIFHLRQQVVRFRRRAAPMREAVDQILETPAIATPPLMPYYRDVLDHVIRTLELVDNVRDLLTSARELQIAQTSNRLNVVMKQLSAWAAII